MSVESLLSKLDSTLGKNKPKGTRIDFKALKSLKEKHFLKLKEGKNNLVFITPKDAQDPFTLWFIHNGLQETAYWSVPCEEGNHNEKCIVCNVIADLQKDYEANKNLWYPIRRLTEYYAPVVVVDSEETIAQGIKWLKVAKSVMTQLTEWLRNLEKDEEPFYSDEEPQKIIITYNKGVSPADQYKLDKKNYKGFTDEQLQEFRNSLPEFSTFFVSKSATEVSKIVDGYFDRISASVDTKEKEEEEEPNEEATQTAAIKLASLKR